jgi:HAD superfamily hydrolase (TIGR01509 family)
MHGPGVIFDFNGVLVFDSPFHHAAWRLTARQLRSTELTDEELSERVMGRTNFEILRFLLGREPSPEEVSRLGGAKERVYREMCLSTEDFALSPGAIDLLNALSERQIPKTIATSSERTNLDFYIERLNLARWFDVSAIVYDDGSRPGKPAPDVYLEAARRLGLEPARCLVVEDALSGMQAATAAGIGRVFGLGPREHHVRFRALPGVTDTIESLLEFPQL